MVVCASFARNASLFFSLCILSRSCFFEGLVLKREWREVLIPSLCRSLKPCLLYPLWFPNPSAPCKANTLNINVDLLLDHSCCPAIYLFALINSVVHLASVIAQMPYLSLKFWYSHFSSAQLSGEIATGSFMKRSGLYLLYIFMVVWQCPSSRCFFLLFHHWIWVLWTILFVETW